MKLTKENLNLLLDIKEERIKKELKQYALFDDEIEELYSNIKSILLMI